MSRRRNIVAALALVSFAGAGGAVAAPIRGDDLVACRNKGQVALRKDGWLKIMAPPVVAGTEGPREIVDFAVPPNTPGIVYATNGAVIKNSVDGGCEWSLFDNGIDPPQSGPEDAARPDIFTHLVAPAPTTLWAAGYDDVGGVPHPHVYQYVDVDKEERDDSRVENGLPAVGRPVEMIGVSQGEARMSLLLEEPPDPADLSMEWTRRLYVMTVPRDVGLVTGTIWKQVPMPAGFGRIEGLTLAPGGLRLWAWSKTHFATTPDATAEQVAWDSWPSPGGDITGIDVNSAGEALVVAGRAARRVDTHGKTLGTMTLPVAPTSMTHGRTGAVRVLSGPKGTFGYDKNARKWVNVTPAGAGALRNLTIGEGKVERIVLGHTKDAIYRFDTYPGETFVPSSRDLLGRGWPKLPHSDITEPYLEVRPPEVTVQPGKIEKADVEFGMPPAPTPLDVFFVVDTTGSMGPAIRGLQENIYSIASRLRGELGNDVCFGVGDFKDYSLSPNDVDKVYRTHQTITCEDDPKLPLIAAALKKLAANGGGTAPPEAQTIALDQMATGDGHTRPLVLPGKQAEFRDNAYKVAVLVSDVDFNEGPAEGGIYPTIPEVSEVLRVNGIKVVSVLTHTNWGDVAYDDMAQLGRLTDSFAPATGVDCDGDGELGWGDVDPNEPLVCQTSGTEPAIGPVITGLVLGVVDPGTVAVHVTDHDKVIRHPIEGATAAVMNLKRASALPFTVPVSCTPAQDGEDLTVTFVPTVRALPVGVSGTLVVHCRALPVVPPKPPKPPEPPLIERRIPRQLLAAALLPPGNPPVQPPGNLNLNAGLSQEEEQQFQLAAVTQGANEVADEEMIELAMSGREPYERATPVAAYLGSTMAMSAGAALAYRRRVRTQYAARRASI